MFTMAWLRETLGPRVVHNASCGSVFYKYWLLFIMISATSEVCPTGSDVDIPDNDVHIIATKAYQGCNMVTVSISEGIKVIGVRAFADASKLSTVELPGSLESIRNGAFSGCTSLVSINLPDCLLEIRNSALRCTALTSIVLPASLQVLEELAFLENRVLKSVYFRGTSPEQNGFFIIEDGSAIYSNGHYNLIMVINSVAEVKIHQETKRIGAHGFCFCDKLTNKRIIVPDSVVQIETRAFYRCSLTHLTLGSSITTLSDHLLEQARQLEWIDMPVPNAYFETKDGALYMRGLRNLIVCPIKTNTFAIPIETEDFGVAALILTGESTITRLEVDPASEYLTSVSNLVYSKNMSRLVKVPPALSGAVTISEKTTVIGPGAFYMCNMITSIVLPKQLLEIGRYGISGCQIKQLTLPENLSFIGELVFYVTQIQTLDFPHRLEVISTKACYRASNMVSVVIRGAKQINEQAFVYCYALKSVTLPETLISIGTLAFSETLIEQINLPSKHLVRLEKECFSTCSSLRSVVIPHCVQYVEDRAFADCPNLASITFMNCETWVSHTAFEGIGSIARTCVSTSRFTQDTLIKRQARGKIAVCLALYVIT